jgi:hypothetical protein
LELRLAYVASDVEWAQPRPSTAHPRIMCIIRGDVLRRPVALQSAADWSQVWRRELAVPNAAPLLLDGSGVLSSLRMSRVITHLAMLDGSCWLFRLDQITSAAGRIANRHQHPGPGIRCLLEGTFNVAQDAESARNQFPGNWKLYVDKLIVV